MRVTKWLKGFLAVIIVASTVAAYAVNIETVPVGNTGNIGELALGYNIGNSHFCGAVSYEYNIGKYEVTAGQYTAFLNAVAKSDPYGLYNPEMSSDVYLGCRIQQSGDSGDYRYRVSPDLANRPVNYVSFWDAARFANWLHNGQGNGDTEVGAYVLTPEGMAGNTIIRNADWKWAVTSEDEWYKAAYHQNNGNTDNYFAYPTSSDTTPKGELPPGTDLLFGSANYRYADSGYDITPVGAYLYSPSPYGTFDQGGNVWEWNDSIWWSTSRGIRGGSYYDAFFDMRGSRPGYYIPTAEVPGLGFRVASSVPEPSTFVLLGMGAVGLLAYGWRRR